ncbi:MAG TPA: hypothetical protein VLR47_03125 [Rhodospirillales bacterium]|nr:hypothetical protein [Rhodospirillales bacterium]
MDRYDDDDRLILPFLGPLYRRLAPIAWPVVRVVAGLNLMPHGAQKLFGWFGGKGMEATAHRALPRWVTSRRRCGSGWWR